MNYIQHGMAECAEKALFPSQFTISVHIQSLPSASVTASSFPQKVDCTSCRAVLRVFQEPVKQGLAALLGARLLPHFVVPQHGLQDVPHLPSLLL